jgi:hypothetical protein
MSKYKPIVDIFSDIIFGINAEMECEYLHGHPLEIINILSEKSANSRFKYEKYPLIALFQDFKENVTITGRTVNLNILIITESKAVWNAPERYLNTFNPVLYPLWDLLIKNIKRSKYIDNKMELTYDKTDRLFWGKQGLYGTEANIFNDFIDAIEIENLKLEIKETC